MEDIEDKVKDIGYLRRKRRIRRRIIKISAFMIFLLIALVLYANRDRWVPRLEGIGTKYQNITASNGSKSGGFPLMVSGGIEYQTACMDKYFVILSDTYFYIYGTDGKLNDSRQHSYSNAVLKTKGKKALIYENGGNRFSVESRHKTDYQKKIDNKIIFAEISDDGKVAVVSDSENYASVLTVYDSDGKEIYVRESIERIFDLSFNPNGDGCVAVTVDAEGGELGSKIHYMYFDSKDEKWTSDPLDTLSLQCFSTSENGAFVFGDAKCAYYDSDGKKMNEYVYNDTIVSCAYYDGKAAMIFQNEEKRQGRLVLLDGPNSEPVSVNIDQSVSDVKADEDHVYVLTQTGISAYNYNGELVKSQEVSESYNKICRVGNDIFLMGYERIDRVEFRI